MVAEQFRQEPAKVASIVLIGNVLSVVFVPLGLASRCAVERTSAPEPPKSSRRPDALNPRRRSARIIAKSPATSEDAGGAIDDDAHDPRDAAAARARVRRSLAAAVHARTRRRAAWRRPCSRATPATAPTGCSSSSRAASSASCSRARPRRRVFLDIRPKVVAGGEQGLLGLAFHPQYAVERPLLRLLHAHRRRRARHRRIPGLGRSECRRHRRNDAADDSASDQREPQRRHARVRAATATSTSASATAAPATTRRTTRRTSTCCSARSCASTSITPIRRRHAYSSPADNPFVGQRRAATRSSRSGCAIRGASASTASTGAAVGRRRRPGRARGSRHADRERRQLRLARLRRLRLHGQRPGAVRSGELSSRRSSTTRTRAAAARSPAATSTAARRARCRAARTSTATTAPARSSRGTAPRRRCCSTRR